MISALDKKKKADEVSQAGGEAARYIGFSAEETAGTNAQGLEQAWNMLKEQQEASGVEWARGKEGREGRDRGWAGRGEDIASDVYKGRNKEIFQLKKRQWICPLFAFCFIRSLDGFLPIGEASLCTQSTESSPYLLAYQILTPK